MSDLRRYPKSVRWSDEDEGWIATAPDLPGCSAFGATDADALGELEFAIEVWIEAAQAAGNPVPAPSTLQADEHSGKFMVRMPRSLHADLVRAAQREGVSLNQHVVSLLSAACALRSVEAAARATADTVIKAVRSALPTTRAEWFREKLASPPDQFRVVTPQNWAHLPEDQQMAIFHAHPYPVHQMPKR